MSAEDGGHTDPTRHAALLRETGAGGKGNHTERGACPQTQPALEGTVGSEVMLGCRTFLGQDGCLSSFLTSYLEGM